MDADASTSSPVAEKKVGFARPSLIIPPRPEPEPQTNNDRKASQFVFDQFNELRNLTVSTAKSSLGLGEKFAYWLYHKLKSLSRRWFTHCFLTIVLIIYTIGGAISFKTIEEPHEGTVKGIDIREARYALINEVTNLSKHMPFENQTEKWMELANDRMNEFFGAVIENHKVEAFIIANRGDKVWTIWNSVVFCATIYTTIGYGHMYPKTHTGRALSIVYALIGIPLFLIALTDFGKLFTRCIKYLWSFVRRLYYTGNCRRVRKSAAAGDIFGGAQVLFDAATFRRPSSTANTQNPSDPESQSQAVETPTTPAISNFEIDDEFNLPISVALFILVSYIICGAVMYMMIERWEFFEAFYFVFISMSTIGFGDYVPRDPVFMIGSIIYLVFGLALMSMCFNVVQTKLTDTFKRASAKIGETMGLDVDEDGSIITATPENVDIVPNFVPNTTDSSTEGHQEH